MSERLPYVELTHDELSKKLGLTRSTISQIEQRAIENFKRELAKRGIEIDDLIEKKPPKVSAYLTSVRLADKANEN